LLLHRASNPPANTATPATNNLMSIDTPDTEVSSTETQSPPQVTFLATVMVNAMNGDRESVARASLDTGASSSLVTKAWLLASNLRGTPEGLQ